MRRTRVIFRVRVARARGGRPRRQPGSPAGERFVVRRSHRRRFARLVDDAGAMCRGVRALSPPRRPRRAIVASVVT
jgi:hypothetical protein